MKIKTFILICLMLFAATMAEADELNKFKTVGDRFWTERDNQSSLLMAIDAYTSALKIVPDDRDLLTRLSIAYYWKGNNFKEKEKDERKKAFTTGQMYAKKLCELDSDNVEGNFWFAVNMALYGGEVGVMKSAFMLPDIKRRMEIVMDREKYYYHGGPQRLLARIDYETPGFFRGSLEKAEAMLKEAIHASPNFTLSYVYLAEIYMEMKKPDLARKELKFVLDVSDDALPEYETDIRRDKRTARVLMKKYFGNK
ncbi:MAG: TRAP transporter TatT component family protein [Desulfobacterales bacterium]|nr:TRAP transporter TatT component family protein [Desulfobacterales bacterium]